jgi:hypothetical protein
MEYGTRKSIFNNLKDYDCLCNDEHAFIEITEWTNGEGYDIIIDSENKHMIISLTDGEIKAITHLISCLRYGGFTKTSNKE